MLPQNKTKHSPCSAWSSFPDCQTSHPSTARPLRLRIARQSSFCYRNTCMFHIRNNYVNFTTQNTAFQFNLFVNRPRKSSAIAHMAVQCCTNQIFATEWVRPLSNAPFLLISENISTNHTLLKTELLGLHFCRWQYGSNFNHGVVSDPQNCQIQWNDAK